MRNFARDEPQQIAPDSFLGLYRNFPKKSLHNSHTSQIAGLITRPKQTIVLNIVLKDTLLMSQSIGICKPYIEDAMVGSVISQVQ